MDDLPPPGVPPAGHSSPPGLPMDAHRRSSLFPPEVIAQIQRTAAEGHYEIRGWGAKRALPSFDDLLFLTASLTRYPLEGTGRSATRPRSLAPGSPASPSSSTFRSRSLA